MPSVRVVLLKKENKENVYRKLPKGERKYIWNLGHVSIFTMEP